ncbi:hypothetical protein B9Z55_008397 [Caenorhabditis nigoni]|uniref:Domain of unknown function WSN domain-containing protein n=1 Tax=Caenorhabditis nigoni TaxID=1611254 RepID=A0A2G5UN53_9PELO|nr:hypothetical protein B9Z55_008397 [Caenorhabditis nigoni]
MSILTLSSEASPKNDTQFVIDKLSSISRVITSISIQNGLADGSIQADDLISEFLNIPSTNLKRLKDFDQSKVDDFLDSVKNLKLAKNSETLEEVIREVASVRSIWSTVDISNLPQGNMYQKLDELKTLNLAVLDTGSVNSVLTDLDRPLTDVEIGLMKKRLIPLFDSIDVARGNNSYQESIETLQKLEQLSAIGKVMDTIVNMQYVSTKASTDFEDVLSDFGTLKGLAPTEVLTFLNDLFELISSRIIHHSFERVHTTGFINGLQDLDKVSLDIKNQWVLKSFHPSTNLDGIERISEIRSSIKSLDDEWNKLSTEKTYKSLKLFSILQPVFDSLEGDVSIDELKAALNPIDNCRKGMMPNTQVAHLNGISEKSALLLRKVSVLSRIDQTKEYIKNEIVPNILSASNTKELQTLKEFMLKMREDFEVVQKGKTIKDLDMETQTSKSVHITEFGNTTETSAFKEAAICFSTLGENFEKLIGPAQAILKIREMKARSVMLDDIQTTTKEMSQSFRSIDSIVSELETIKSKARNDTKLLRKLENLPSDQKSFGEGLTILKEANLVSGKSGEFTEFTKHGISMEDGVIGTIFEKKFREYFGDFDKTKRSIQDFLDSINDWLSQVTASQDNSLLDFASTFSKYPKLDDLDLMTDRRLMAVEQIGTIGTTKKLQDDAAAFKKSLLELSKLDLRFARFQNSLETMPDTIQRLATNLVMNIQNPTTVSPPKKSVTALQKLRLSTGSSTNSTTTVIAVVGSSEVSIGMACGVGGAVLLGIVSLFYGVLFCNRKKDEKWSKRWKKFTCGFGGPKKTVNASSKPVTGKPAPISGKTPATTESTAATGSTSVTQNSTEAARPSGSTAGGAGTPIVPLPVAPEPVAPPPPVAPAPATRPNLTPSILAAAAARLTPPPGTHPNFPAHQGGSPSNTMVLSGSPMKLLPWGFRPLPAETDTNPNPDATVSEHDKEIPITDPKFGNEKK